MKNLMNEIKKESSYLLEELEHFNVKFSDDVIHVYTYRDHEFIIYNSIIYEEFYHFTLKYKEIYIYRDELVSLDDLVGFTILEMIEKIKGFYH